jgi:hypothetical protein
MVVVGNLQEGGPDSPGQWHCDHIALQVVSATALWYKWSIGSQAMITEMAWI